MKRIFSAASLLAASLSLIASPALAHDEVVGTSPTAGQTVTAGLVNVEVTFNEDLMQTTDGTGLAVQVTDPSGAKLEGCPMGTGPTLSAEFNLNQSGTYQVDWRSVSNDGHPNEGTFSFDVDASAATSTENSAVCAMTMSTEGTKVAIVGKPQNQFLTNLPFLVVGLLLVVAGAAAGPLTRKLR
ncbi:MAG: copper resistance protein CopC, partial [Micrococcales bacterium]